MSAVMYRLPAGKTFEGLVSAVENHLTNKEKMETQRLYDTEGNVILQARAKSGNLKMFIGMNNTLTLTFAQKNNDVKMEIGNAKWMDKGIVLPLGLWPLTASVRIYQQAVLVQHIETAVLEYLGVLVSKQYDGNGK